MLSTAQKKSQSPTAETKDATPKAQTKSKNAATPAYLQRKASGDEEQVARKQDTTEKAPEEKILDDEGISQPLVQRKLEVGAADDPMEKEADQVADAVVQNKPVPNISSADQQASRQTEDAGEQVQAKSIDEPVQTKAEDESVQAKKDEAIAQTAQRQGNDTEAAQPLRRKTLLQAKGAPQLSDTANEQAEQMRGNGAPLPDDVRMELQNKLGGDFSKVNIHNNPKANNLAKEISARAFTVGEDIFFAAGEYDPQSQEGKRLLSHELTHVVQQNGALQKKIQCDGDDETDSDAGSTENGLYQRNGYVEFTSLPYPTIARVAAGHFGGYAPLIRHKNYSGNRSTRQTEIFTQHMSSRLNAIKDKLKLAPGYSAEADQGYLVFKVPSPNARLSGATGGDNVKYLMGSLDQVAAGAIRPTWTREGRNAPLQGRKASFEVDHIVEAQVGAASPRGSYRQKPDIDAIGNYILLRGQKNQQKGDTVKENILDKIRDFTRDNEETYGGKEFKDWNETALKNRLSMKFNGVSYAGGLQGGGTIGDNDVWEMSEIEQGEHIQSLLDASPVQIRCVTLSSGSRGK